MGWVITPYLAKHKHCDVMHNDRMWHLLLRESSLAKGQGQCAWGNSEKLWLWAPCFQGLMWSPVGTFGRSHIGEISSSSRRMQVMQVLAGGLARKASGEKTC